MNRLPKVLIAALLCAAALPLRAQFSIDGHSFQAHAFFSQGFASSDQNNFLTMKTSSGSFAMTDAGVNLSTQIGDKLRVGAQFYTSNVGELGRWHPQLDWAVADYRFRDWFGVRAGKVKTSLGLYNDTQDMGFLHTWALLPQSIYPLDLRDATISHEGGDIYGEVSLHKAGSVSYTAYGGMSRDSKYSGYYYSAVNTVPFKDVKRSLYGADARWTTPVAGLMVGGSYMHQRMAIDGTLAGSGGLFFRIDTEPPLQIAAGYADYTRGKLHLAGEYRKHYEILSYATPFYLLKGNEFGDQGFFVSAAYRLSSWLEAGAYNSRYYVNAPQDPSPGATHIFDQAVTARFDLKKYWHVKIEGHFMDGYGDTYSAHGFYPASNPLGLRPRTNMLIIRTGFNL